MNGFTRMQRAPSAVPHPLRPGPAEFDGRVPQIVDEVIDSRGHPLPPPLRDIMESRFGHDFSSVRIHTDPGARESAYAVHANPYTVNAYTVNEDVVFGRTAPDAHRVAAEGPNWK